MANVYTNAGKAWVAAKMSEIAPATSGVKPQFIGWGTGVGTSNVTDTTLFTEAGEARVTATLTTQTTSVTGDTFQAVGTLTATAGKTVTNAGVFDASTTGNLVLKGDHAGVPLLTNDAIQYTFQLQQS